MPLDLCLYEDFRLFEYSDILQKSKESDIYAHRFSPNQQWAKLVNS